MGPSLLASSPAHRCDSAWRTPGVRQGPPGHAPGGARFYAAQSSYPDADHRRAEKLALACRHASPFRQAGQGRRYRERGSVPK